MELIKALVKSIVVAILLVFGIMIALYAIGTFCNYLKDSEQKTSPYPKTGVVTEISYEEDSVTVTDGNGEIWVFYGAEDWQKGDVVSLLMDTNGTENIYDDEIVSKKYSGTISNYTSESDVVDMSKVTGYEVTETGLLLHFEDGTGYYWEK